MEYVFVEKEDNNRLAKSIEDVENRIGSLQDFETRASIVLGRKVTLTSSYKKLKGYKFLVTPDFEQTEKDLLTTLSEDEKKNYLRNLQYIMEGKPIKSRYHLHPLKDNTGKSSDFTNNLKGYWSFVVQFENSTSPTKPQPVNSLRPSRIICLFKKFEDGTIGLAYLGEHNFTYHNPSYSYKFKEPEF